MVLWQRRERGKGGVEDNMATEGEGMDEGGKNGGRGKRRSANKE